METTESPGIGTRTNAITMKIESQHFTERLRAFYNKSLYRPRKTALWNKSLSYTYIFAE